MRYMLLVKSAGNNDVIQLLAGEKLLLEYGIWPGLVQMLEEVHNQVHTGARKGANKVIIHVLLPRDALEAELLLRVDEWLVYQARTQGRGENHNQRTARESLSAAAPEGTAAPGAMAAALSSESLSWGSQI
jgi:hypothetical protein